MARSPRCLTVLVSLAASCALAASPASAASIKGTVRFAGGAVEQKKLAVTVDQYVCGKDKEADHLVLSPQGRIRNAVVWLESPPPSARGEGFSAPPQIDQQQCVFTPRIVIVPAGGTVEFLNSDRLLHNVHSASKENPPFNRTQPKARTIPIVFHKPEIVRIDCDLHPWMRAWVVVAEHRFYAVTDEQGGFALENVPPGRHTLRVWQESLGSMKQDIVVADGITRVTVEMTRK